MKHLIIIITFLASIGFSNSALAVCKEPKDLNKYRLSSDLKANQAYLKRLKNYEHCLSNLFKKRFDPAFIKKYNQQRAEEAALREHIRAMQSKKEDILNPDRKYGGLIPMSDETYKEYKASEKKFNKEKFEAAKRLGLDNNNQKAVEIANE